MPTKKSSIQVTEETPGNTQLAGVSKSVASSLIKVVVKTEGKDATAGKSYTLNLDEAMLLKDAWPHVAADLGLDNGWSFLADDTLLATSAESALTIGELIQKTGGKLELRREKPEAERELEEASATLERDKGVRDKLEEKRKAEEKELREHIKLTKDALTALQTTLATPNDLINADDVKVIFATLKNAESMARWGGSTNESLRELEPNQIEKIVRSLGLPRTASRAPGDGSFLLNEFVARLRADKGVDPIQRIAQAHVIAVNEIDTRVESFQEEWQKKACEAGFSQISAELSIAYKSPAFKGSASANYGKSTQNESVADEKSEIVYMVGIQEVRKARVVIPAEMIVLSPMVEDQFAIASRAGAHALRPLFERHGYFVITEYTLGGKLYTSETEKKSGSAAEQASKFQKSWGVAVDATGWGAQVQGGVASKSGESTSQKQQDTRQSSSFHLSAKGGNVTDRHDPSKWIASLKPENWEVIAYGRLIPIYEFLRDAGVREACRKAVQDFAKINEDQQAAMMNAEKRMALARWAVMSRGVADRTAKVQQDPSDRGAGKYFRDQPCHVSSNWVDVPEGMYFKGAQLKVDNGWLKIGLLVTDDEQNNEAEVMSPVGQEAGDVSDYKLGDEGIYFDKTPLFIPPQQRIIGLRLRRLENPSNRVGLELKLADLDGNLKGKLVNSDNNEHYDHARDCRPSASPTTFPDSHMVAGIRLENTGEGTYGFVIFTLPGV